MSPPAGRLQASGPGAAAAYDPTCLMRRQVPAPVPTPTGMMASPTRQRCGRGHQGYSPFSNGTGPAGSSALVSDREGGHDLGPDLLLASGPETSPAKSRLHVLHY